MENTESRQIITLGRINKKDNIKKNFVICKFLCFIEVDNHFNSKMQKENRAKGIIYKITRTLFFGWIILYEASNGKFVISVILILLLITLSNLFKLGEEMAIINKEMATINSEMTAINKRLDKRQKKVGSEVK